MRGRTGIVAVIWSTLGVCSVTPATTFLLLTTPRSGTMMLADALDELDCVALRNLYASNPDNPGQHHRNWGRWQKEKDSAITHRGTTMHRVGEGWISSLSPIPPNQFWGMLNTRHDYCICLRRKNILRQYLSQKVGVILRGYGVHTPRSKDPGPILIPITEFIEHARSLQHLEERVDAEFPDRLKINYEQLCSDWDGEILRIQGYIGLPPKQLSLVTIQQENRRLRDALLNYDEIAHYLERQGWEEWLD